MTRPVVMLHSIMPDQISGPNSAARRIFESSLANRYDFRMVTQTFHAGGRVNLALIRDLRTQIMAADPDLIHLSGLQASGFHAVVAARLATRAPILMTIRGFSGDALALSSIRRAIFNYAIEPLTLALCTRVATVTRAAGQRLLVRLFRRKYVGALHNAAPSWLEARSSYDSKRRERERLGLPDVFIATFTGRLVTDKGIPTLLEVASRLPEGFSICVVGDGPWLETIRSKHHDLLSSRRLIVLGQRSDVQEILRASDVFLFATLHENLSNALLEAMSLSLPTVVTDVGGNPEVVRHGETGFLVAPGDAQAMVSHLVGLKEDPALCRLMGDNGRIRIETAFSQKHIYAELCNIYEDLLDRSTTCKGHV